MQVSLSKAKRLFALVLTPVLAIAGAGLVCYGVALIYLPAAYLVGGIALLAAAWDASQ